MELISKLTVTGAASINIGFNPYTFYTQNNNYMKIELAHDFTEQSTYLYGYLYRCSSNWFSFENGMYGCYFNIANTTGIISVDSLPNLRTTDGVTNPISIVMDNGTATATQGSDTQTNTYSGNMPNGNLIFYPSTYSNEYGGEFYGLKIYGAGDVLAHHYVGFDDGVDVGIEDLVTGDKYTPTGSGYTIQCEEYTPPTPPTPTSTSKIYLGYTNLVAGKIKLGANDVSAIYLGTSLLYPPTTPQPTPPSLSDCVCFEALDANASIRLHASQDYSFFTVNLWYSTDGGTTFSKMDRLTPITLPNIGDKMYVYGSNVSLGQSNLNYVRFLIYDGDVSVSGDLTRLLNPNGLTTLPDYAFVKTFSNNTHLADVSGLTIPVTTVGKSSLAGLFEGCSNITTAPTLQATTLGEGCYEEMFYGCSNLNYIKVGATTWNTSWANNWVNSVAATGTFVKPAELVIGTGTGQIPSNSANGIPTGWTVQNTNDYLCFTANAANCTVGMTHNGTNQTTTQPVMYYSTDKTNWTLWDYSTITLANVGDKVYFYGNNPNGFSSSSSNYSKFTTSGSVACSGNIMTLITRDGSETTIPSDYCFTELFSGASIVSAANLSLPATTLTDFCYDAMFYVCSHLTTGPSVLPATSIPHSAYEYMFMDCSSLTATPDIQAQVAGDASCDYMFKNCSSLTTVPSIPSVLVGGATYYQMFMGCTSLVNLQHLRITSIGSQSCTAMFKNCTALTTSPILEAETLAPSCYEQMFDGCSSLNSVTCLATNITAYHCTYNWMNGVSATGTFTKNPNMSNWTTGVDGIPTGWTVVDAQ